ncbi:MAG: potassium channel protein [Desulfobacteraceae bacterium 4572_123]|nr:MAG: potassium channel protein [Desulfobacteraceae bacterium 4572_123]
MNRTAHLITAIVSTIGLIALGTLGYMLIEHWSVIDSLYMTVITLAAVGYGEVHDISQTGRIFTIVLIFFGVSFVLYVFGNIVQFLVEGQIRLILGRRKLDRQINRLKNHYIICGYGRMGRSLCKSLIQKQQDFIVIEQNTDRIPAMEEDGILFVIGSATEETSLLKAGIKNAGALMTVLGSDADNVFLVLLTKGLNPNLCVIARASQNSTKNILYTAGANVVVSPYEVGARRMAHAILRPGVIRFLEMAFADENTDIHLEQTKVEKSSNLVGVTLKDSEIRKNLNLIVLAMIRGDDSMQFNPSAETIIKAGDTIIAVGENKSLKKLEKILNPA